VSARRALVLLALALALAAAPACGKYGKPVRRQPAPGAPPAAPLGSEPDPQQQGSRP
jgi:hypothetical protein